MRNCDWVRTQASLYLSGELAKAEQEVLAAHLAKCSACAAKIAEDRSLDAGLRSAIGGYSQDTARLEQAVRRKISLYRRRRRQVAAGAIAATVALLAAAVLAWGRWYRPPQSYTDAAVDHRTEVVDGQPRRWRSKDVELAALAGQTGLELDQTKSMAAAGYRLEHAKICGIGGRRMLHLVFSNGVRRYSVFVSPRVGSAERVRTVRRGSEEIAGFETGHFSAIVVSNGSAADCTELAQVAERRL